MNPLLFNVLRWAVAIASVALFLYNANALLTLSHLGIGSAMLALSGAGLAIALQDMRTWLTVVAGGAYLHALFGLMSAALPGGRFFTTLGWMALCAVSAAILVWIWFVHEREPGDANRMRSALTLLVAGEALSAVAGYATHPGFVHAPQVLTLGIVIFGLLALRAWLPSRVEKPGTDIPAIDGLENPEMEKPS